MVDVSDKMIVETERRERNRRDKKIKKRESEGRKREGEMKEGCNNGYLLQACVLLHTSSCLTVHVDKVFGGLYHPLMTAPRGRSIHERCYS